MSYYSFVVLSPKTVLDFDCQCGLRLLDLSVRVSFLQEQGCTLALRPALDSDIRQLCV